MKKLILILLILTNIICFVNVGRDKRLAIEGAYREPEVKLVAMSSLGAAPGTLLGFKVFHHKTSEKKTYLRSALKIVLFQNLIMYILIFFPYRKKKEQVWRA